DFPGALTLSPIRWRFRHLVLTRAETQSSMRSTRHFPEARPSGQLPAAQIRSRRICALGLSLNKPSRACPCHGPEVIVVHRVDTAKEHRKRSGSGAKCDDPRVAVGPAVLSESE